MTQRIIHHFEAIEVDDKKAEFRFIARCCGHDLVETVDVKAPVRQTGKFVIMSKMSGAGHPFLQ